MSYTQTTNGATALKTTNNNIVDYFMMFARDLDKTSNHEYLEKCWADDPKKTVAIIFNGRDRVNGKKEKKVANEAMLWLRKNKFMTYCDNIQKYIDKYGCWKDLLYVSYYLTKNCNKNYEINMFAKKLINDKALLENDSSVSLCAKWAPSEGDRNDKRRQMALRIATAIYGLDDKTKMKKYRQEYLTPLRKKINIVETMMCEKRWNEIKYECVPGVASKKLLNAFMKNDNERYQKYLEQVRNGEKEIKVTGILPHELVKFYIDNRENNNNYEPNETIELQWKAILDNVKKSGRFDNSLPIVDLSGSMFSAGNGSIPAQVAIALGILTSQCCNGMFKNKFITFSEEPELVTLEYKEPTLIESLKSMMDVNYGFSTDFVKCCESIISYGIKHNIPDSEMPKKLFVFTDMQFNYADSEKGGIETVYQNIIRKYKSSGYTAPKFIFWNLSSDNKETFPVNCNTDGTAVVSGFSEQLLKIFMNYDEFKPEFIVNEILEPYMEHIIISDD